VNEKRPDQLRFSKLGIEGVGEVMVGWTGPWPPPEKLGVAVGRSTGMVSVFEPDSLPDDTSMDEVERVARVIICKRVNASQLPDEFAHPNVFRGADYEPVDG
jgi:hypothetical protein